MKTELHKKLWTIQQTLNAPKNQRNNFGGYNYRSAEDILEAVKPLLQNITLTVSDEIVLIGNRYYVKATATLSDGEDEISVTAYAREEESKKGMDASQLTGATSSYARKYALNGLFCIDDAKDPDTDAYAKQTNQQPRQQKNPPKQQQQKAPPNPDEVLARFCDAAAKAPDANKLREIFGKCWKLLPKDSEQQQKAKDVYDIRLKELNGEIN
ncbi:DNA single-strand annealing protein [Escherichia coli UMNK88]|uniref:ERF family protein n=1 Tax=Escherichia coli TaxID=562 RepID=UPI00020BF522|nr:ERF family protein [Escherichia coli]AEE56287.1 DNA single-strand annealing protein [Escherichia coli UMNK88]MCZ0611787.1 ERF family protein [Escherichia coli]HBD3816140.1 ERF family protein [Escherichia coli]HBD3827784.1 ERF family protein [Escherichia coli]HBD3900585.1 ERF family protein [Escherichia coli]